MADSKAHKAENRGIFSLELQHPYVSPIPKVIDENSHCTIFRNEYQFTQLCRLCAKVVDNVMHLFTDNDNGQNLADKINSCLPITVTKNDCLPKQLCSSCIEKLQECFQFSETCISAENELMSQNSPASDCVCFKHSDSNEESNFHDINYSCPLCVEGTLQVVSKSHTHNSENVSDLSKSKEDNVSTCIVSSLPDNICQEDVNINFNAHFTHNEDKSSTELCMEADQTSQESIQKLSAFNFVCRICNKFLNDIETIHNHCKLHSKYNFFPCALCDNTYFINESQLRTHFSYNHQLLKSNSMKEVGENMYLQDKLLFLNPDISDKNSLTVDNFFTQLDEKSSSAKFNICTEISKEETLLYDGYILQESKSMCEICGSQFATDEAQLMHLKTAHIQNVLEAPDCSKYSEPIAVNQLENKTQNVGKTFSSEVCGAIFNQLIQVKEHERKFHEENVTSDIQICHLCSECKAIFPEMTQISEHCSLHEQSNINSVYARNGVICEYCDLCFLDKDDLKQHLPQHTGKLPYVCLHCKINFESHYILSEHKQNHKNSQSDIKKFSIPMYYLCEFCGMNFEQWQYLCTHRLKSHQNIVTFSNDENDKMNNINPDSSEKNSQSHLCEMCGMVFESHSALYKHRKHEHPHISKYKCPECGKMLANLTGLIIHRRLHTGEKPFVCDLCGKSFHQSSGMYTHRRTHTRECPYRCEYCGQAYNVKGDLDNHRRAKHTKERPFKCETCQKSFLTSSVFYQHRILHTGVRKFKCMYCEKSFARWNALRLHIRTHTGEKPYICYVCQRGFAQKGDMKKHMKTQHSVQYVPETS